MGEFESKIKDITGLEEHEFIKLWIDRNTDWSAMKHIEDHGIRCLKMIANDKSVTWDENQRARRESQNRACLTLPVIADFVNKAHGEFCQSAPQATVEPIDSEGDPKVADVLKGLIYNIAYQFNGNDIHKDAAFYVFAGALACWRVNTQFVSPDSFNVEPTIDAIIKTFSIRWDLACKRSDTADKKWVMILQPMTKADFILTYGEDAWRPQDVTGTQATSKDFWFDKDKCVVAECQWIQEDEFTLYELPDGKTSREKPKQSEIEAVSKDGKKEKRKLRTRKSYDKKIWSCIISGNEVISEPTEWPDYTGDPIIPVMIATGRKMVVEGKILYKALISDGLDIAVLINYWVTAITEAGALQPDAPWLLTEGQIKGYTEWNDASAKSRYLRWRRDPQHPEAGPPTRNAPQQFSAGMMQMLEFLHSALRNAIGMQQASMGMQGNEKSGVAIQKRKQEGDAGKYPFLDNIQRQIELEAKILTNILPSTMDTARIERIMGPDGKSSLAYLKQKNPKTGEVLDISVGKYDTRVTLGASFATQRDEQRDLAVQVSDALGKFSPQSAAALAPKIVRLIGTADADDWAKIVIATLPPEVRAFYQQSDDKSQQVKLPPEMVAQMQAIGQKLQQTEQLAQQQAAEIEKLKQGEAVEMAKIEKRHDLDAEKIKIEREKIMKEITVKEMEIRERSRVEMEKLDAEVTMKTLALMESTKSKREALIAEHDRIANAKNEMQATENRSAASATAVRDRSGEGPADDGQPMPEVAEGSQEGSVE